jgi:hypothetical protein
MGGTGFFFDLHWSSEGQGGMWSWVNTSACLIVTRGCVGNSSLLVVLNQLYDMDILARPASTKQLLQDTGCMQSHCALR